ncbi:MAG: hypothetical protein ACYC96_09240 [Fimbriimonadaceae bacterium]
MERSTDHDAVWAETVDGGLLHQLFGFYPTLHDATIRSITYSRGMDRLEMTLDYEDEAEGDTPLRARISIAWTGVQSAKLGIEDNFLTGLRFKRRADQIVTELKTMDGADGEVVSEAVEAKLVALDPTPEEPTLPIMFRLE